MLKKILCLVILFWVALNAAPKTLVQYLENWAGSDTTGKYWVVYNLHQPETHFVTESSVASQTATTLWMAQIGNFNGGVNPWDPGDTLIALGSTDTAYINNPAGYGDNPNHCGFYWFFCDTINSATPEFWQPADTVRPIPQPVATQVDTNIEILITNPQQTASGIADYAVLGYWLWADTTGSGTPDNYDKELGFVPVQGGAGQTTVYSHPIAGNYGTGQTVRWAYRIVAQPDTAFNSRQVCPGYSTHYFSSNSNAIIIVGTVEESSFSDPEVCNFEARPNPFQNRTDISWQSAGNARIKIYNATGQLVRVFSIPASSTTHPVTISWDGTDDFGRKVSPGVYFCRVESGRVELSDMLVLIR